MQEISSRQWSEHLTEMDEEETDMKMTFDGNCSNIAGIEGLDTKETSFLKYKVNSFHNFKVRTHSATNDF